MYYYASKKFFDQRKETSIQKKKIAKILSYQPTSTRPWNSQQIASFAILLASPTLQSEEEKKKKKKLPTRIWGLQVEEIFEKNLGWWEAKKSQEERDISIYVYAKNRKGWKAMCF